MTQRVFLPSSPVDVLDNKAAIILDIARGTSLRSLFLGFLLLAFLGLWDW